MPIIDVSIRYAVAADAARLDELYRAASLANESNRAALQAHPEALVFSAAPVAEHRIRVAVVEGRIVGFATLLLTGAGGELEDLFVDPVWMKHGIGRALVLDAAASARSLGLARIHVTANGAALGFFEKAGFVLDGPAATRFGPAHRMHLDVAAQLPVVQD